MKTWQEQAEGEMRRLVAASDGLLGLGQAGAPSDAVMEARGHVCAAVVVLNTMLKRDRGELPAESGTDAPDGKKGRHGDGEIGREGEKTGRRGSDRE